MKVPVSLLANCWGIPISFHPWEGDLASHQAELSESITSLHPDATQTPGCQKPSVLKGMFTSADGEVEICPPFGTLSEQHGSVPFPPVAF